MKRLLDYPVLHIAARNNVKEDVDVWSHEYGNWVTHKLDKATYSVRNTTFVIIIHMPQARICFGLGQLLLSLSYVQSGRVEQVHDDNQRAASDGDREAQPVKECFRLVIWARVSPLH